MELCFASYRLLFRHPFGTAHGTRDGTDAVFVRLRERDMYGYGEATLPPYLGHRVDQVVQVLRQLPADQMEQQINAVLQGRAEGCAWAGLPPARAAISMAYYDLISRRNEHSVASELEVAGMGQAQAMVTLGSGPVDGIAAKLKELPATSMLKVKLGSGNDRETVQRVMALDDRPLFLDANQGWTDPTQALAMIALAGEDRIVGIEQPFAADRWDLHRALQQATGIPVYGDESIQGPVDLERAPGHFAGVNVKLMKCGGLDQARQMAARAHELGLRVMLGSMSESSLGSAAMAQLAAMADLADLDGPWLIKNDPFEGLAVVDGRMQVRSEQGIGVALKRQDLNWIQVGA